MRTTPIKPIGVFFVLIGLGLEHFSYRRYEVRNFVLKIFRGVKNIKSSAKEKNCSSLFSTLISFLIIITLILFDGISQRYVKGELGSPLFDPLFK